MHRRLSVCDQAQTARKYARERFFEPFVEEVGGGSFFLLFVKEVSRDSIESPGGA